MGWRRREEESAAATARRERAEILLRLSCAVRTHPFLRGKLRLACMMHLASRAPPADPHGHLGVVDLQGD